MSVATPSYAAAQGPIPPGWTLDSEGRSISRRFVYKNFDEAFAFMRRCAVAATRWDHHPEWSNVYNRVDVRLTTHDTGGLTEKDLRLAQDMNDLSGLPHEGRSST